MPGREKVLAFPVYPGVTPLGLIGPLTAPVAIDTPLQLQPAATFAEVPDPRAVIVPGGGAAEVLSGVNAPGRGASVRDGRG